MRIVLILVTLVTSHATLVTHTSHATLVTHASHDVLVTHAIHAIQTFEGLLGISFGSIGTHYSDYTVHILLHGWTLNYCPSHRPPGNLLFSRLKDLGSGYEKSLEDGTWKKKS